MDFSQQDITGFADRFNKISGEIKKVIIGQSDIVDNVLAAITASGNVLLEGLPGLGKTELVKTLSQVLDMEFSRIQFTPDLMPADITGTDILTKEDNSTQFKFRPGPVFANIVLADEINRATPKTQSALLEAMQEKTVTVGGISHNLPKPFFVIATQNPLELEGTYPLPEAQLDRFLMKLHIEFPDKEQLYTIVEQTTGLEKVQVSRVANAEELLQMGEIAKGVPISRPVGEYAMELILKTHPKTDNSPEITKKYVRYGASPRAAQAIITVARIYALLDGRFNVAFDDIKKAALPTLRHRLFLNFEALADDISPDTVINELIL